MENELERVAIESLIYEIRGQKVMLDRNRARPAWIKRKKDKNNKPAG